MVPPQIFVVTWYSHRYEIVRSTATDIMKYMYYRYNIVPPQIQHSTATDIMCSYKYNIASSRIQHITVTDIM